jgi:hypothetical protein
MAGPWPPAAYSRANRRALQALSQAHNRIPGNAMPMFNLPAWPALEFLLVSSMGSPLFRPVAFDRPNIAAPSHANLVRLQVSAVLLTRWYR